MRRSHVNTRLGPPLFFRLWMGFVLSVMLCIFGAVGYLAYSVATNPEGAGRFAGRVIGGAIDGARQPAPTQEGE